jgi:cell division septation protein DedD
VGFCTNSIQGWKGSVKARHLVMAMRDHFGESSQREAAVAAQAATKLEKGRFVVDPSHPGTSSEKVKEAQDTVGGPQGTRTAEKNTEEDEWALSFIKISRFQVRSFKSSIVAF